MIHEGTPHREKRGQTTLSQGGTQASARALHQGAAWTELSVPSFRPVLKLDPSPLVGRAFMPAADFPVGFQDAP